MVWRFDRRLRPKEESGLVRLGFAAMAGLFDGYMSQNCGLASYNGGVAICNVSGLFSTETGNTLSRVVRRAK